MINIEEVENKVLAYILSGQHKYQVKQLSDRVNITRKRKGRAHSVMYLNIHEVNEQIAIDLQLLDVDVNIVKKVESMKENNLKGKMIGEPSRRTTICYRFEYENIQDFFDEIDNFFE